MMPAFSGSDELRHELAEYVASISATGKRGGAR